MSLRAITTLAAGCFFSAGWVLASPSIMADDLLAIVPGGAEVVSELRSGQPASFLVMTRSNTVDLTDFQSLTGADLSRVIGRVVLIATSGPAGPLTGHALLADGHYDSRNITKVALANGAAQSEYRGIPVLVLQPMAGRSRDVAPDVRWLSVIDGKIVMFGTTATVQELLRRYLDRTPPAVSLLWNLAHLRRDDQSWSIVAPSVRVIEMVRRSLVSLDATLADPIHAGNGLVLGIHFGRQVELEYENETDWRDGGDFATSGAGRGLAAHTQPMFRSYTYRNQEQSDYRVIKMSRPKYEEWIAAQTSLPGEAPPHAVEPLAQR